VRPLFPQLAPVQLSADYCEKPDSEKVPRPELIQVIQELNRFCVYEIADRKKGLKDLPFPPAASSELVRLDQDCAALGTSAELDPAENPWTPVSQDFLAQAGKPEVPLRVGDGPPRVRLAFLDTQPTHEGIPERSGRSPHGFVLAHIARKLVCTPESDDHCAAQITTQLALPILAFDAKNPDHNVIDRERGGYLGMQSDLAEAIRNEVDSWWRDRQRGGSQRHLVLNLSLAWDGRLFGGLDEAQAAEMRAGTQAVYQALQYAAKFDVLVLAAAGNQKREPCENFGPLLPAAWESEPPQEESCRPSQKGPLLYAVGGLQANNQPLGNSRPGGMPRRAAYGESILYTGSSVATAVASAIAAAVWDSYPDYDSHRVMNILDGSGEEVASLTANFGFGTGSPPTSTPPGVHRLLLCDAFKEACMRSGSVSCPRCDPLDLRVVDHSKPRDVSPPLKGSCDPWVRPQPEESPRPNCAGCPP